jgi:uncharacterized membrane protein YkoI
VWLFVEEDAAMNMKKTIRAGLLAILFLVPAMAAAHAQSSVAKITEAQAMKIALEQIPGKVTDVKIERKRGKNVYVVEIQTPDGGEKDVFVDIVSGKIVGTD